MSRLMDHVIERLRRLPETEQDQVAGEVEVLLEELPIQPDHDLRRELKEGSAARASRDGQEAALFDFVDPWETTRE